MTRKSALRIVLYPAVLILYFASTVPVGLFIYSMKSAVGVDIFKTGGFHAYMRCLRTSFPLSQ